MRLIDAEGIRIKPEFMHDVCGMAMIRVEDVVRILNDQPTIQPEIVRCKDCQYWNKGSCECPEHAVNCQDYYVGDIETEAEYFCGYAERREVTT